MSFILRAGLVIGALSYLAATRGGPSGGAQIALPRPEAAAAAAAQVWDALPAAARDAALREGGSLIARHAGAPTPSGDTLAVIDRRPAWRGP